MSDPDQSSAISRIIAAHRGAGTVKAAQEPALKTGLTRAIRRAAMPYASLAPDVADVEVQADAALSDAVAALPSHGLTAAIEDEEGRRGLFVMAHPLVDALIEVQATGMVEEVDQPPRKITRIDEALCRDFVDLVLGAFAQESAEQSGRDWPDRMHYGSNIADRAQLNLLMPERGYRMLRTSVTMGGRKTGDLVVLLPVDAAIARARAVAAPPDREPVDWSAQMLEILSLAPMTLDAVLMRVTMPLGKVEGLETGDLVPFDHSDLSAVTLEDDAGHVFARGSLGQLSGRRAVRFGGPITAAAPPPTPPAPELAVPPAMGIDLGMEIAPIGGLPAAAPPAQDMPEMPVAPPAEFDPNALMGDFDPKAPIG